MCFKDLNNTKISLTEIWYNNFTDASKWLMCLFGFDVQISFVKENSYLIRWVSQAVISGPGFESWPRQV